MIDQLIGPNPAVRAQRAADQAITNVTSTAIIWDTVDFESHEGMAATSDAKIYVPRAGIYAFSSLMPFEANATGGRQGWVQKNGAGVRLAELSLATRTDGGQLIAGFSGMIDMQPGDYLETYVYQNSGGNLNVEGSAATAAFLAVWMVSELNVQ
jgi:hypothetical protein